jgi:hypothetical protein
MYKELEEDIKNFKTINIKDNYTKVLSHFESLYVQNDELFLVGKLNNINNNYDLMTIRASDGKLYLVVSTFEEEKENLEYIALPIKEIFNTVNSSPTCNGICLNPDDNPNQLMISKEYINKLKELFD